MTYAKKNNETSKPIEEHKKLKKNLHTSGDAVKWQLPSEKPEKSSIKTNRSNP